MPRRWLSVRAQRESKNSGDVTQDQFDFEFVPSSHELDLPPTPVKPKANMFNRAKRSKNDLGSQSATNNDKHAIDKRLQLTKVEDSWIGVAYGSPTHPPTSLPALPSAENSPPSRYPFRNEGPSPPTPSGMARCRKFSNFFKPRSSHMSISAPTNVYRIDGDQKLGMPIARKPLRENSTLPVWINSENPEAFTSSLPDSTDTISKDGNATATSRPRRTSLPRLEIQIPNVEMDRYSVMFGGVSGIKPSSLLERRSRNLSKLANQIDEDIPPIPPLKSLQPRRSITPNHHRQKSYNLFPTPPRSRGTDGETSDQQPLSRQSSLSRPHTADGLTSCIESRLTKFERRCVTPEKRELYSSHLSPDETVASSERDDSPWRSSDSLQSAPSSRTSMGSEIFFDVKPARDSNGREQSHFIIHKPESSVELALSQSRKSKKSKGKRREDGADCSSSEADPLSANSLATAEEKWRLSLELNQAIIEVEKLTSPFGPEISYARVSEALGSYPPSVAKQLLPSIKLRKRLDGLAIGIPSPITERSEEFSPRQTPISSSKTTSQTHSRPHIASLSIKPAPLSTAMDAPLCIEDFGIMPPPVPVKDAKFIPMSKFAAAGTGVKLIEHQPKRRKPKNSKTESQLGRKDSATVPLQFKTGTERERPAKTTSTLPSTTYSIVKTSTAQAIEPGIVAVAVKPAAEVSIARKISLSRKQSQKIEVSSPKSRAVETMNNMTLSPMGCRSPTILDGHRGHKPGASMNIVIEEVAR